MQPRRQQLISLNRNLNILRERETKFGGNAPLELLNQIEDHKQAIDLIEQALAGNLTDAELDEALAPLVLAIHQGQVVHIRTTDIRWLPVVIALVAVIGVLVVLFWQLRPEPPPDRMSVGTFNVAVAQFTEQDENGNPVSSDDGRHLAEYLTHQLEANFKELELDKIIDVWGPEQAKSIAGQTRAEREQAAQARAEDIGAHVLVYGTLTDHGAQSRFAPEFFVNLTAFEEADNITGQHQLGDDLQLTLPFGDKIEAIENPALAGRTRALVQITLGLAYLSVDRFEDALPHFQAAVNEEQWRSFRGKEVAYLLLGNTYLRLLWQTKDGAYLNDAAENFIKALEINPAYGRARLAWADVLFARATQADPVDEALLTQSLQEAEATLNLPDQPESFNVEIKVHYHRAKIALARYNAGNREQDWLAVAATEFQPVINDFEAGDKLVRSLAAQAYAGMGFVAYQRGDSEDAVSYLEKAIENTSPILKAEYYKILSGVYASQGDRPKAIEAMHDALNAAENSDMDEAKVLEFRAALQALENSQ